MTKVGFGGFPGFWAFLVLVLVFEFGVVLGLFCAVPDLVRVPGFGLVLAVVAVFERDADVQPLGAQEDVPTYVDSVDR